MMTSCDTFRVARWPFGADVAFVFGIDELGNIGNDTGVDFTDWGRHFSHPNSFFQSKFRPVIEQYPDVVFTLGAWLGEYDGITNPSEMRDGIGSIEPYSEAWDSWLSSTVRPIAEHDQIELLAHGLQHEDWVALPTPERNRRLAEISRQFRDHLGVPCEGFNTWPYGTVPRDDIPGLLAEQDMYVTGILTTPDLTLLQRLKAHAKRLFRGKRYVVAPTTTKPIGESVALGPSHTGRLGEFSYWSADGKTVLSLPYTQNFNVGYASITDEITELAYNSDIEAPVYYLFAHLRENSPEQSEPESGGGIEGEMKTFERLLSWLDNQDWVWSTSLTHAAAYHDLWERAKVSSERCSAGHQITVDTSECFDWTESIPLTLLPAEDFDVQARSDEAPCGRHRDDSRPITVPVIPSENETKVTVESG